MEKHMERHILTKAGDSIIRASYHSDIFDKNPADVLVELNQVILHLNRLADHCDGLISTDIEGLYGLNLMDTLCRFQELRDGEFGDYVNWNTIAKAIRCNQ